MLISQMVSTRKTVQRVGKTCPGPHNRTRVYHPGSVRDPDTYRGHGKMDLKLRDQLAGKVTFFLSC